MRPLFTFILTIILFSMSWAQTRKMDNAASGRTYAVQNQSRSIQPLLMDAERKFRTFDYDGTFLILENAIAQNPYSTEALVMRAKFRKMVGMQSEAEADIRLANHINPLAANLFGYHGNGGLLKIMAIEPENAFTGLSNFQKLNYYYKALDLKMANSTDQEDLFADFEGVIENIEEGQLFHALDSINTIIDQFPNSAIAFDLKGVILKKQGKFEEATDAFSKAITIEPDFAIAWYNLAQMKKSLGDFEKAKTYLDKAISLQKDLTKAYFERALVLKKMGKEDEAIDDYNKVIEMRGKSYMEAFLNRGLTKKMLGDYNGAFGDLNKAIEEFPNNAELRKNRGNLNLLFGLPRKAIDDFTKAIQLDENFAEAYYNRALAHFILFDKISGCYDLDQSMNLGYEQAAQAKQYFCSQY